MSVDEILSLPRAQGLQLRTVGLMRQNVKMKPAGGGSLRDQVESILGEWAEEWAV